MLHVAFPLRMRLLLVTLSFEKHEGFVSGKNEHSSYYTLEFDRNWHVQQWQCWMGVPSGDLSSDLTNGRVWDIGSPVTNMIFGTIAESTTSIARFCSFDPRFTFLMMESIVIFDGFLPGNVSDSLRLANSQSASKKSVTNHCSFWCWRPCIRECVSPK